MSGGLCGAAGAGGGAGGPNIVLSLLAREATGILTTINSIPPIHRLKSLGVYTLFTVNKLDRPAAGICSEVVFLSEVMDSGDWAETQIVISRISPRLMGDPTIMEQQQQQHRSTTAWNTPTDPNLPPYASRFYAGGGRTGLSV